MSRLIHYSRAPLVEVVSRAHADHGAGSYKTPGLWFSVEGDFGWLEWCKSERWGLDGFTYATEIILKSDARICTLADAGGIDEFTKRFTPANRPEWDRGLDWLDIRSRWQGLIIAPYCWERRMGMDTMWYYGWDCASGVIWDADAIGDLRPTDPPDMTVVDDP